MNYLLALPIALIPLIFIAWNAFNKKSSPELKKFARITLIIILALGSLSMVIIYLFFGSEPEAAQGIYILTDEAAPPPTESGDLWVLLLFAGVLALLLILAVIASLRDLKRRGP